MDQYLGSNPIKGFLSKKIDFYRRILYYYTQFTIMPLKIVESFDALNAKFAKNGYSLMAHQANAVRWMARREDKTIKGGILADEMGVGKTIETIGLIVQRPVLYTLIIVPASLINQWKQELGKFVSGLNISIHNFNGKTKPINIVITSFVKSSRTHIQEFRWDRIIIDEAHIIRNPKGKIYKSICKLKSDKKWCLTGTPIQNYLSDIKSLFKFIGVVNTQDTKKTIKKYLFRRTKEEVNIKLGGYEHHDHIIEFESLYEKQLYQKVQDNIYESVDLSHLEIILRMRQASILPQLVIDGYSKKKKLKEIKWKYKNTKLSSIVKTLVDNPDEKPVVFCYFRKEIEFLEEKLEEKSITYNVIQGSVDMDERQEIIASSDDFRVLIVQIMAGSTGLNLQKFNSVYFTGPHWNPTHEQQAIARVYRMGQKKKVKVRRFILKNTIEEWILRIQGNKIDMINDML